MMFMGMAPVGALLGGASSDRLGAPLTVAIGGFASVLGAWWFSVQLPKIRVEARKTDHCSGYGGRRTSGGDDDAGDRRMNIRLGGTRRHPAGCRRAPRLRQRRQTPP